MAVSRVGWLAWRSRAATLLTGLGLSLAALSPAAADATIPVTGWYASSDFSGIQIPPLDRHTNSPSFGNLASPDAADNVAAWAALPSPVAIDNGMEIVLTGSVTLVGTTTTGDGLRFGLFNGPNFSPGSYDPQTTEQMSGNVPNGWRGLLASAGSNGGPGFLDAKHPVTPGSFPSRTGMPSPVIGLDQSPSNGLFDADTYSFEMRHGRYGTDALIAASFESTSGEPGVDLDYSLELSSIVTPNNDTVPSVIPAEFDRVGFLLTAGMNTDFAQFHDIVVTVREIPTLVLDVNVVTGAMRIRDAVAASFDVTGYHISSEQGNLVRGAWTSLDEGEGGDPVGVGWDELGVPSIDSLGEVSLTGSMLLTTGQSFALGTAFDTSTPVAERDVRFFFATSDGQVHRGIVNYNSTSVSAAVPEPSGWLVAIIALASGRRLGSRRRGRTTDRR